MIFSLLTGIQALPVGLQLDVLENTLIGPNFYRQLFTVHGMTMMSFFAVPVVGPHFFDPTPGGAPALAVLLMVLRSLWQSVLCSSHTLGDCKKEGAVTTDVERYFNELRGIALLWIGVLAGPLAWFLYQQVSYMLATLSCAATATLVLHAMTAVALLIALAGAGIAWKSWRRTGGEWPARSGGTVARSRFMALGGLLLSALFFLVIVAQGLPNFFLSPC